MQQTNETELTYFVIKGISDDPHLQLPIFILVFFIYVVTLGGNLTILLLVIIDIKLHTPMYFFLANLSIMDISSATVTQHKILAIYLTKNRTISYLDCMTRVYFYSSVTASELLMLSVMSYDRYLAICKPLHYSASASIISCVFLTFACWILGFLQVIPYIILLSNISCYRSNLINHFFCDLTSVMKLSCSNIQALEILILTEGLLMLNLTPCLLTFIPYAFIIISILKIKSISGKQKAFYTCSSHLTVVVILYFSLGCQYLKPVSKDSQMSDKLLSFLNSTVVPLLNPLIYSLRNRDVKAASVKIIKCFFRSDFSRA
ncbi:olfactory receptor 8G17-like [Aquarana catesbeiana]|uniref:olfactory receptor 8G17-like n=1 Tax=Aquarana catesbeiana TaxID=8400 RepID=UPI003CC9AEB3